MLTSKVSIQSNWTEKVEAQTILEGLSGKPRRGKKQKNSELAILKEGFNKRDKARANNHLSPLSARKPY